MSLDDYDLDYYSYQAYFSPHLDDPLTIEFGYENGNIESIKAMNEEPDGLNTITKGSYSEKMIHNLIREVLCLRKNTR